MTFTTRIESNWQLFRTFRETVWPAVYNNQGISIVICVAYDLERKCVGTPEPDNNGTAACESRRQRSDVKSRVMRELVVRVAAKLRFAKHFTPNSNKPFASAGDCPPLSCLSGSANFFVLLTTSDPIRQIS